jgi:hypothetical protein
MFNKSKNKIDRSKKIRGAKPITKSTGLMIAVCAAIVLPALWTVGKAEAAPEKGSLCNFDESKTERTPAWLFCNHSTGGGFWISIFTTIQEDGKTCDYSTTQLQAAKDYCVSRMGANAKLMGAFTETEAAQDSTFEKMQKNATPNTDGSTGSNKNFETVSITTDGFPIAYQDYKDIDEKNVRTLKSAKYHGSPHEDLCSFDPSTLQKTPAWVSCKNEKGAEFWMSLFPEEYVGSNAKGEFGRHCLTRDSQLRAAENYCQSIMGDKAKLSDKKTEAEAIKENPLLGKMQKNGTTNTDGSDGSDRIFAAVSVTYNAYKDKKRIIPYRDYKDLKSSHYKHIFPKGEAHPLYGSQPKVSNSEIPNSGTTNGFTQKLCDFPSSLVMDDTTKIQPAYLACLTTNNPIKIKHAYAVQTFVRNGSQYCKVDEDQFEKAQEECKKNGGWVFPLAMTAKEFIAMEAFYPKEDPEKFKKFSKTLDLDDELIAPYIDPTTFQKV